MLLESRFRPPAALVLGLALTLAGCGSESGASATRAAEAYPLDPRLAEVRDALDAGIPDAAITLLDQLGDEAGVEALLLRARAVLFQGDAVGSLKRIADAKRVHAQTSADGEAAQPDARILATEVEIYVALDRIAAAQDLLREAYKAVGRTPELERARGVLLIRTPGGGREGLTALETARELAPGLPFVGFPLAQAHHLVGREALGAQAADQALVHALLAREYDPLDPSFRELEAEARAGLGDFQTSLELYRDLVTEGRPLGDTLAIMHKNWGTQLLLEQRKDEAVAQYCAARDLGLELGEFASALLVDHARARIDQGLERVALEDWSGGAERFRAAIDLAPDSVEAWNHLGVCLFRQGEYYEAGEVWTEVLVLAARDGIPLPEPVHLNLARAWRLADETERAYATLADFLDGAPAADAPWVAETRAMLARLEAENVGDG